MTGLRSPSRDAFETGRFFTELSLETDRFVQQLAAATRLPHLTSDTPIAPTRQDISMQHSSDYSNCPGCKTGRFAELTPTPEEPPVTKTAPTVQYGIRRSSDDVTWPDRDNELFFDTVDFDEYGGYISAANLPALRAAAKSNGVTLVQRTLGPVEDVKPPLPTTPGSLIRATALATPGGIFGLTNDGDDEPWRELTGGGDYYGEGDFTNVTIIFDAGATA